MTAMTAMWRALSFIGRVQYPRVFGSVLKPGIFTVAFQVDGQTVYPFSIKIADRFLP